VNKALPDPEILRDISRVAMSVWGAANPAPESKRGARTSKSASPQKEN
jgi:hypothetical protein